MSSNKIKVDEAMLKSVLGARQWSESLLAQKMGMPTSTFSIKKKSGTFTQIEYKLLCMVLGKDESELLYKEPTKASSIIDGNENAKKLAEIESKIDAMNSDLSKIAQLLVSIEKAVMETKGQTELNRDELEAIFSKTTAINQTVGKIGGHLKYSARVNK